MSPPLPHLYLITGRAQAGHENLARIVAAAGRGGLRMVQVREKELPFREVRELVAWIRSILPPDALVLANATGREPDFGAEVGADGVHLGGSDLEAVSAARRALPAEAVIGYSAHRAEEIAEAAGLGADYVSLSPVFPPLSKGIYPEPLGIDAFRAACRKAPIPVYALGGIDRDRIAAVREAGAWGAASMGAILQSSDPEAAVRALLSAWEGPPGS